MIKLTLIMIVVSVVLILVVKFWFNTMDIEEALAYKLTDGASNPKLMCFTVLSVIFWGLTILASVTTAIMLIVQM